MDKNKIERIEDNISLLGDKLSEFLYATDYFGLPEGISNEAKQIIKMAHELYERIAEGDYLE